MIIKSVKAIPIHYTLEEIFRAGTYQVKNRYTIVCVVEFENGIGCADKILDFFR